MAPTTRNDLLAQLKWRYATKLFDPTRKISEEDWKALEEALILSPSAYGLQPWKFLVVQDPAIRKQLRAVSWNQSQVEDCSHLVVFAARRSLEAQDVDHFLDRIVEVRGVDPASLKGYKDMMNGHLVQNPALVPSWSDRQTFIALGNFMTSAAMLGIDTCPIEGLDPAKYDEILGLKGTEFGTLAACPAGYRQEGDKYATLAKVRFPESELFVRI